MPLTLRDQQYPEDIDMDTPAPEAFTVSQPITDEAEILSDMNLRLERIEQTVNNLREGVNVIGEMMNSVVDAFGQISAQMQNGGLASLLGNLMGGKKNG